jgi:hypothetical protein
MNGGITNAVLQGLHLQLGQSLVINLPAAKDVTELVFCSQASPVTCLKYEDTH